MLKEQVFTTGALLVIAALWMISLYLNHKTYLNLQKALQAMSDHLMAISALIAAKDDAACMRETFFGTPTTLEMPSHCFCCGVLLEGGATQHKEGCAVRQLIEKYFPKAN